MIGGASADAGGAATGAALGAFTEDGASAAAGVSVFACFAEDSVVADCAGAGGGGVLVDAAGLASGAAAGAAALASDAGGEVSVAAGAVVGSGAGALSGFATTGVGAAGGVAAFTAS